MMSLFPVQFFPPTNSLTLTDLSRTNSFAVYHLSLPQFQVFFSNPPSPSYKQTRKKKRAFASYNSNGIFFSLVYFGYLAHVFIADGPFLKRVNLEIPFLLLGSVVTR